MAARNDKAAFLSEAKMGVKRFDESLVSRAWDYAEKKHGNKARESGETYFSHPVKVAQALLSISCDSDTLAAALLHDVVEDTDATIADIRTNFNDTVANLVQGVTKLTVLDFPNEKHVTKERLRKSSLRKLFVSIADDPRVALIKIADRVHNLSTLGALPRNKQIRIARESLEVFAPLAEALGLGVFQARLQDLAFQRLEPELYESMRRKVEERQSVFMQTRQIVEELIQNGLEEVDVVDAIVFSRQKEIYSIYRKMVMLDLDFEQVHDIIGVRIIVKTEADCYLAKYVVDQLGREISYSDYIGKPHGPLGYQSLHKVIVDEPAGTLIEVQIRTQEMHERAERGAAAHWLYKLCDSTADPAMVKKVSALRETLEILSDVMETYEEGEDSLSPEQLREMVRTDVFSQRIHVLSPKNDVYSLPLHSTPLDYAYYVHTELGHEFGGARVNGSIEAMDYVLKDGDVVEILPKKGGEPRLEWLQEGKATTPKAQQKIRHYFRQLKREELISTGKGLVGQITKVSCAVHFTPADLAAALANNGIISSPSEDSLYIEVAEGRISAERIIRTVGQLAVSEAMSSADLPRHALDDLLLNFYTIDRIRYLQPEALYTAVAKGKIAVSELQSAVQQIAEARNGLTSVEIVPHTEPPAALGKLQAHAALCCRPVPGDPIVGYVTIGKGMSIHRSVCPTLLDPKREERNIPIDWSLLGFSDTDRFTAELLLSIADSDTRVHTAIQSTILRQGSAIISLQSLGAKKGICEQIRLLLLVGNAEHLNKIVRELRGIVGVLRVSRTYDN